MSKLSDDFHQQIQKEIERIEEKSAVEIVPVYAKASSEYLLYRFAIPFAMAWLVAVFFPMWSWVYSKPWQVGLISLFVLLIFHLLFLNKRLLLLLVPSSYKRAKVEARAKKEFVKHEVFRTRDRSGLLIFVSELEHAVYILADKGFDGRFAEEKWCELSHQLAEDFSRGVPGDTFIRALDEMRDDLAEHFPVRKDDQNELPDHVRS